MLNISKLAGILAAALFALMWVSPAQAQASRTWISGVGDDVNPCSRTAPCKTFAGAISKTAAGGEIDCLDPGGFGGVTITKSITFDCGGGIGGQVGSILVGISNGITVNGAGISVKIRNMSINGLALTSGSPGLSGIKFLQGAALVVEHVGIFGFGGTAGSNGGIDFEPGSQGATSGTANLKVLDVEVQYGLADGILIKPTGTYVVQATLDRVSAMMNGGSGMRVESTNLSSGTGVSVSAFDCEFANNTAGILAGSGGGTVPAGVTITNSILSQNSGFGVLTSGSGAIARVGGSQVSGNGTGILAAGGSQVKSWGDNYFAGNGSDGTPSGGNLTKL